MDLNLKISVTSNCNFNEKINMYTYLSLYAKKKLNMIIATSANGKETTKKINI